MMKMFCSTVLAIFLSAVAVVGQDTQIDRITEFINEGDAEGVLDQPVIVQAVGSGGVQFPDLPVGFEPDEETLEAIQVSVREYYLYRLRGYDHRTRTFEWQYLSSQIIFFVVITIVLIGLYFSWMQFHRAQGEVGQTTMEASKDGFKLSSPVLGVIILVLSLAFFYLYLVHVYPISEIG